MMLEDAIAAPPRPPLPAWCTLSLATIVCCKWVTAPHLIQRIALRATLLRDAYLLHEKVGTKAIDRLMEEHASPAS